MSGVDAGSPGDNATLTGVLRSFADDGFTGNVTVTEDGMLRCPRCRTESAPEAVTLHALRRMEGASDPDDMLAVLGVECPECGERGAAVTHFGPTATPGEVEVLRGLDDQRQS